MEVKRTALIHVMWPEEVKYFIMDGDYTHLNDICVNADEGEKVDELAALVESHKPVKLYDIQKAVQDGDTVIIETGWA